MGPDRLFPLFFGVVWHSPSIAVWTWLQSLRSASASCRVPTFSQLVQLREACSNALGSGDEGEREQGNACNRREREG